MVIRVSGIAQMQREIFGPILHVVTFKASQIDAVIAAVNATGYGLTFGLHTRIDDRVQRIVEALHVGNIYVNRNQIGAVVGSQPFGGEGLSGTGPKAGGPDYLARYTAQPAPAAAEAGSAPVTEAEAQRRLSALAPHPVALQTHDLPGPTGESNRLSAYQRAPLLCLGPGAQAALAQAEAVRALGGLAVEAPGLDPAALARLSGFAGAILWGRRSCPCAGAGGPPWPHPAADRRSARCRPCGAGTACLHRHHRLGRQCTAAGQGIGRLIA